VSHACLKRAFVNHSIGPHKSAFSIEFAVGVLAYVLVPIGENISAIAVLVALVPFTFVPVV
jgi:hypothetical protein